MEQERATAGAAWNEEEVASRRVRDEGLRKSATLLLLLRLVFQPS